MTARNIFIALLVVGVVVGVVAVVLMRRVVGAVPGAVRAAIDPVTGRPWQTVAEYNAQELGYNASQDAAHAVAQVSQ